MPQHPSCTHSTRNNARSPRGRFHPTKSGAAGSTRRPTMAGCPFRQWGRVSSAWPCSNTSGPPSPDRRSLLAPSCHDKARAVRRLCRSRADIGVLDHRMLAPHTRAEMPFCILIAGFGAVVRARRSVRVRRRTAVFAGASRPCRGHADRGVSDPSPRFAAVPLGADTGSTSTPDGVHPARTMWCVAESGRTS